MSNTLKRSFAIVGALTLGAVLVVAFQNLDTASTSTTTTSVSTPSLCSVFSDQQRHLRNTLGQVFQGFGCQTIGGTDGSECWVKSDQDDSSPGTLRYCVEKQGLGDKNTPVVVKFDKSLAGAKIQLRKSLAFFSNTTVDGRMPLGADAVTIAPARIATKNPCYPDATKSTDLLCDAKLGNPIMRGDGLATPPEFVWKTNTGTRGDLFRLRQSHVENGKNVDDPISQVIVSDLIFTPDAPAKLPSDLNDTTGQSSVDNPCYLTQSPVTGGNAYSPRWVKGCPVMINIGGTDPKAAVRTQNIVIANNEFYHCAEKCLHGNGGSDLVTITRNHFHDSYFASLILMSANYDVSTSADSTYDQVAPVRYTFYHNHFERVLRRNPRCALYVWCHVFGNVIADWGPSKLHGFGLSGDTGPEIVAEWNFFAPPASFSDLNPAVDLSSNHYDAEGNLKDQPQLYMGRWALVSSTGVVSKPLTGTLYIGPTQPVATKPFDPSTYYKYSTGGLSQDTYNGIVANAGPRRLN